MVIVLELKEINTDHLTNINLKFKKSAFTTIIGPSGAGKSSLLMLLNRLTNPIKGEIFLEGENIKKFQYLN